MVDKQCKILPVLPTWSTFKNHNLLQQKKILFVKRVTVFGILKMKHYITAQQNFDLVFSLILNYVSLLYLSTFQTNIETDFQADTITK